MAKQCQLVAEEIKDGENPSHSLFEQTAQEEYVASLHTATTLWRGYTLVLFLEYLKSWLGVFIEGYSLMVISAHIDIEQVRCKLLVGYLLVFREIHIPDHGTYKIRAARVIKHSLQVVLCDVALAVCVEALESCLQVLLMNLDLRGDHGSQELGIVNLILVVSVQRSEGFCYLLTTDLEVFLEDLLELAGSDSPCSVDIHVDKSLPHLGLLVVGERQSHHMHGYPTKL